ncbi:chromosome segregation in meiosis-related protein [Microsporum audouinii]
MATANDNVDDLFDYDAGLDDILREVEQNAQRAEDSTTNHANPSNSTLGIDDELKVSKKRAPISQLDESRILSQEGIPKLRKMAKTNLKLKGRGHEFSDAGRLLNFYRLWLDELYPRAKFSDTLTMIEKLGHSKRIQVMRKEWMDEGKPKVDEDFDARLSYNAMKKSLPTREKGNEQQNLPVLEEDSLFVASRRPEPDSQGPGVVTSLFGGDGYGQKGNLTATAGDDELFEWDNETATNSLYKGNVGTLKADSAMNSFPVEEDDLDRLLSGADGSSVNCTSKTSAAAPAPNPVEDDYENDWEAMQEHDM